MTDQPTRIISIPDPVQPFTLRLEEGKSGGWYGTSPEIRGLLIFLFDPQEAVPRAIKAAAELREARSSHERIIAAIATAMEAKRRELIAQPLARIWPELAEAALTAALSAAWQPIESAPLNEEAVLICTALGTVGEAKHYKPEGWYWQGFDPTDYHDGAVVEPTHYQPIPSPPESKT